MYRHRLQVCFAAIALFWLYQPVPTSAAPTVDATFLYRLSDFNGPVIYNWVSIFTDSTRSEVYVADISQRSVRIFNNQGMELYGFGEDSAFGAILGGAVHPSGDIFLISYKKRRSSIVRTDYRGEPKATIQIRNLPLELEQVQPNKVVYRNGRLYLSDASRMQVLVVAEDGSFIRSIDLAAVLELNEQQRSESGIAGFSVDEKENLLFTVTGYFSGYKLFADGRLASFGTPGSTRGKFGIVAGIVSDDHGNIFVADTLRCAVLVFDRQFRFQTEFGYRGPNPHNLIAPMALAFDHDKLYVAQRGNRGVSVFRIDHGERGAQG